ncbi:MAG: alpha/beta fold hydrolase [Nannocystales bacterium]
MPTARINGARLNYVQLPCTDPNAEDLIMVHGLATSLAFWYLPYGPEFSSRYRVTLFDLRGHGRSEITESGYTVRNQARDLRGLMHHLEIERAHFMAHSFGGAVALALAADDPAAVASMVLADTQLWLGRLAGAGRAWPHGAVVEAVLTKLGLKVDVRSPFFGFELLTCAARIIVAGKTLPPELISLVGPSLGRHPRRTAQRWLDVAERGAAELRAPDGLTASSFENMHFPALAMYGERSKARLTQDFLRSAWPQAKSFTLPEAGHFFPTSRADAVIAACSVFWDWLEAGNTEAYAQTSFTSMTRLALT